MYEERYGEVQDEADIGGPRTASLSSWRRYKGERGCRTRAVRSEDAVEAQARCPRGCGGDGTERATPVQEGQAFTRHAQINISRYLGSLVRAPPAGRNWWLKAHPGELKVVPNTQPARVCAHANASSTLAGCVLRETESPQTAKTGRAALLVPSLKH